MLTINDIKNTYWGRNGLHQDFVDNELKNIDGLPIKKGLKDKYKRMKYAYYRFYNDGDKPKHKVFRNLVIDKDISVALEKEINIIIEEIKKSIK